MEKHKCRVWCSNSIDMESASSSWEEGEDNYEWKKTDPEMSPAMMDAGSVVLQERESESESSRNQTRRRSKRIQKHESWADPEAVSSVSDVTAEEDVAFSLMMLSRDKWTVEAESKAVKRAKYRCETCKKVFKSYQALGGHRASHKKMKYKPSAAAAAELEISSSPSSPPHRKLHECPVCFRVFSSGQALGGHKRSHVTAAPTSDKMIDLNLPPTAEDDEIELSAVSDAQFATLN